MNSLDVVVIGLHPESLPGHVQNLRRARQLCNNLAPVLTVLWQPHIPPQLLPLAQVIRLAKPCGPTSASSG